MPPEQPPIEETVVQPQGAVPASSAATYEPIAEQDRWLEEDEELPRRPRRRLLRPLPLALLGVLLTACGFIGGVLVEKGETPPGGPRSHQGSPRCAAPPGRRVADPRRRGRAQAASHGRPPAPSPTWPAPPCM
jgi:hypothetical protein